MTFDKPIQIQYLDQTTGQWSTVLNAHAHVNKYSGSEYLSSGADQSKSSMTFTVRYSPKVAKIFLNTQLYRIVYRGTVFDIQDYDDYLERHQSVKLLASARGVAGGQ